jgi:hypothetical protein
MDERNQIWACFRVNGASSIASVRAEHDIKNAKHNTTPSGIESDVFFSFLKNK